MSAIAAGHVYRQQVEVPSQRHIDLYRLLESSAHRDSAGRLVCWWPQEDLADRLGVSVRTLRNLLADLRQPGLDPRHPRGQPPGRRLGLVKVEPQPYVDKTTGRHRMGGNLYVLVEGYNPWSRLQATKKGDLTSADPDSVACLNKEKPLTQVQEDGSYTGHWPTTGNEASEPIEIAVEPPEHALLKRAPSERQLLATLTEAFGDVEILSVAANDRPATDYKTARGRTIDLTGGEKPEGKQAVRDLRQALGELIDHTCRSGTERCTADQKCGRHTRRRRAV